MNFLRISFRILRVLISALGIKISVLGFLTPNLTVNSPASLPKVLRLEKSMNLAELASS